MAQCLYPIMPPQWMGSLRLNNRIIYTPLEACPYQPVAITIVLAHAPESAQPTATEAGPGEPTARASPESIRCTAEQHEIW